MRVLRRTRYVAERRFAFLLAFVGSVSGLTAAALVVVNRAAPADDEVGNPFKVFGVAAVVLSWALLHAGYARWYEQLYRRPAPLGGGVVFPECPEPTRVEFLYLAFTLGATFAVSDVTVVQRSWRWRMLVHGTLSFFYNAAVLAVAIGAVLS